MRYIKFSGDAGYCGTTFEHYEKFEDSEALKEDSLDTEYLDSYLEDLIHDNGESYEYLATGQIHRDDYDSLDEFEEALGQATEDFWGSCSGTWEEISKEEYEEMS